MGEEVEKTARRSIERRYELLPYIYSAFDQTSRTGIPVARSLAIEFTTDEHVYWGQYQQEYLFGDHILVASVRSTDRYADVYLPAGAWYRMSDDTYYPGGRSALVDAPIENLPVFVRAGGVVPMQSVVQSTSERPSDTLQLHIYYGSAAVTSSYYEDDGSSYAFQHGAYHRRAIRFDPARKEVTLAAAEGSLASRFGYINAVFHHFPGKASFSVNGTKADAAADPSRPGVRSVLFRSSNDNIQLHW